MVYAKKCREKFVKNKMSPIFFRNRVFFRMAALGNRPSQCFQTSRASEKNRTQDRCGAVRNSAAVRSAVRKMLWTIIFHLVIFSKKFRLINLVIFFLLFYHVHRRSIKTPGNASTCSSSSRRSSRSSSREVSPSAASSCSSSCDSKRSP